MKITVVILSIGLTIFSQVHGQFRLSAANSLRSDSIKKVTQKDYNDMLAQLGITSTRPQLAGLYPVCRALF